MKIRSDIANLFGSLNMREGDKYHEFRRDAAGCVGMIQGSALAEYSDQDAERISPLQSVQNNAGALPPLCREASPMNDDADIHTPPGLAEGNERDFIVTPNEHGAAQMPIHSKPGKWGILRALSKAESADVQKNAPHIPYIGVYSLLGGAGTTTIAAGLAWALAGAGWAPVIADLGSVGTARLFFGLKGDGLEGGAGWNAMLGQLPGATRKAVLLSAARRGADALAAAILSGSGDGCPPELASVLAHLDGCKCFIFDVPSGRSDLWERMISRLDFVVIPVRPDLSALLAVDEILRDMDESGVSPSCLRHIFVLNQFDAEIPLHLEIARNLSRSLGPLLAPVQIPTDLDLNEAVADGMPFASPAFSNGIRELVRILPAFSASWLNA